MVRRSPPPERHDPEPEAHGGRQRELVLAPNEQAYVLDTTKGQINCYVGPNKTSLAQTDQPVVYAPRTRRFESAVLEDAVQLFATAPANWYMLLDNPAQDDQPPTPGVSNGMVPLRVGEKVNVRGPASFPLWPGQTVQVIEGHSLRSNQYLRVRVYDAAAARGSLAEDAPAPVAGQVRVVRGTETSFYMPPTGFEVVPEHGRYVRDAVTLERLQYCVLVSEDGRRRYVRGEAVVFPEPNEGFLEEDGRRAFAAIELSDTTGLHVKVTAPYVDGDGVEHPEGEELFLAGRSHIYFPRHEHALLRKDGRILHQAIAIPRGEGRYALDRATGEVRLVRGPCMFLPDPRKEVLVRRVLDARERALLFPEGEPCAVDARGSAERPEAPAAPGGALGALDRPAFVPPSALTLGPDPLAAIRVQVRSGFAVQVVDRTDARRVLVGPRSVLLSYDETMQPLLLSTGKPKSAAHPLPTVFLRVAGNEVSDHITVRTKDMVQAELHVKHRVRFEGDPDRWFAVENYVQLLCDHTRSLVAELVRKVPVQALRQDAARLVREAVLGARDGAERPGRAFEDNGMRIVDVEVLEVRLGDEAVDEMLAAAQLEAIRAATQVAAQEANLAHQTRLDEIERALAAERHETERLKLELRAAQEAQSHAQARRRQTSKAELAAMARAEQLEDAARRLEIETKALESEAAQHQMFVTKKGDLQRLEIERVEAQVRGAVAQAQAFSPQLVAALDQLGSQQLLAALSENFGELAAVEGRGLLETARKYLDFVPARVLPVLGGGSDPEPSEG